MPINQTYTTEQKKALAARLRLFRENCPKPYTDRHCSQEDVARALNITRSNYTYFEQGKTIPNIFLLQKLADFYAVSVDKLIGSHMNETG
mgnify:CR=1 FL=1